MGKPLFIRGKKKIVLTEEGAFLQNQAQEIMNLIDKTESAFHSEDEMISGDIYLGCGETPVMGFITKIFQEIIFPKQAYTGHENLSWFGTKYQVFSPAVKLFIDRLNHNRECQAACSEK